MQRLTGKAVTVVINFAQRERAGMLQVAGVVLLYVLEALPAAQAPGAWYMYGRVSLVLSIRAGASRNTTASDSAAALLVLTWRGPGR
jgi:hypothetical protein